MFEGATILMWYHSQTLFLMLHSQIALSSEVASSACLVVWLSEVPHMCRGMMPRTLICRGFTTLVPILLLLALLGWSRIEDWLVSRPSLFSSAFSHLYTYAHKRESLRTKLWVIIVLHYSSHNYADQYPNKTQILK